VVRSIAVEATRKRGGAVELLYTIEGDPARVRLPEPAPPRRVDGLWRHTCFEAFIAPERRASVDRAQAAAEPTRSTAAPGLTTADPAQAPASFGGPYVELNFSPSGEWAAYAFEGYRSGIRPLETPEAPMIALNRDPGKGRWSVRAALRAGSFAGARARLALAAVIEDVDGRLAYWALKHPSDVPDFHHPGGFTASL
jgi:hypothetical protein